MCDIKIRGCCLLVAVYCCLLFADCRAMDGREAVKPPETAKADAPAPDAYFWDFGRVKKNSVLSHNFIFENNSEAALNINDVTVSCGCVVSGVDQKRLEPGHSAVLKVKLDTRGYSGIIRQFVYLNTDSAENSVAKYTVQAEIK